MIGDSAIGAVQEECFGRVARALVGGFSICEEEGVPLNELQRIELFKHALRCMDGFAEDTATMLATTEMVDSWRPVDLSSLRGGAA